VVFAQRNHGMAASPSSNASYSGRGAWLAVGIIFYYTSIQYQINQIFSRNTPLIHPSMGMKCYYIAIQQDVLLDVFYQHSSVPSL